MTEPKDNKEKPPVIIGVIGDVCAGKSTASRLLREILNPACAQIWDADQAVREIQSRPEIIERIVDRFGDDVLAADGRLDRVALGARVFRDANELAALTAILREPIDAALDAAISDAADSGADWLILDAPTLCESGKIGSCDRVIYIAAPESVKNARARSRGWTEGEVARREARLDSAQKKKERSDFVIENSGDMDALRVELIRRLAIVREELDND